MRWRIRAPCSLLGSRCPIWSDVTAVNVSKQWREDWTSASVANNVLVTDRTIRQPKFNLPRRWWSLLSLLDSSGTLPGQPPWWAVDTSELCTCGQWQSMNHTVNLCALTKLEGSLQSPHDTGDDTVCWLENMATSASRNEKCTPRQNRHLIHGYVVCVNFSYVNVHLMNHLQLMCRNWL